MTRLARTTKEWAEQHRIIAAAFDRLGATDAAAYHRDHAARVGPGAPPSLEFEDGIYTAGGYLGYLQRTTDDVDGEIFWTDRLGVTVAQSDSEFMRIYGLPTRAHVVAEGERVLAADEIAIPRSAVSVKSVDAWRANANLAGQSTWGTLFSAVADALDAEGDHPTPAATSVPHEKVRAVRNWIPRMQGPPQQVALDVLTILGLEDVR